MSAKANLPLTSLVMITVAFVCGFAAAAMMTATRIDTGVPANAAAPVLIAMIPVNEGLQFECVTGDEILPPRTLKMKHVRDTRFATRF